MLLTAIKRGGNIGILLGPESGRLFALDIDDDQLVEEFLNRFPWLANTLQSRSKRGCQFWFRLEKGCAYPNDLAIVPLKRNDRPYGELRLGGGKGAQSVNAFLFWLTTEYKIPHDWRDARFGIRAWHNPSLLRALEELSPARALLELIDRCGIWDVQSSTWDGTGLELRAKLLDNQKTKRDTEELLRYRNAAGQYLIEVSRMRPNRVRHYLKDGYNRFEIFREITV
jgi:hypothetical protein